MKKQTIKSEALVMRLLDTASTLERRLDSALSFSRGVTFNEYRLLSTLKAAEAGLTRVALAEAVSLTPSGVTRALRPLEKLGYVSTAKNQRDARQSLAAITEGGNELLADVQVVLTDFYNELGLENIETADLAVFDQVLLQLINRRHS